MISPILVFIITYALFLISGFLFRLDRNWYDSLAKPPGTPPGFVIGLVWFVLFFCISLSYALLDARIGIARFGPTIWGFIIANYAANQVFSYFAFTRRDWFSAGFDSIVVALTAFVLISLLARISTPSALLLLPYALWASYATYLSFSVWSMNRQLQGAPPGAFGSKG